MSSVHKSDVVIIGSGAAGLSAALACAPFASVVLISKTDVISGATRWAQGGIAAALSVDDSPSLHAQDTISVGGHLCHKAAVEAITQAAPSVIEWLASLGVVFSQVKGHFVLGQEGGHGLRRIVHSDDATGLAISSALAERVLAHPNITVQSRATAIRLLSDEKRCVGVECFMESSGQSEQFMAKATVLASGGASKQYAYTTHNEVASGDGIAMAWHLGCRIVDLEFQQFHPTCLYHPNAGALLLSEAIRGEGGELLGLDLKPFMQRYDARGALAPRDIVARAIDQEMKDHGWEHVYLDISHRKAKWIQKRFPTLYSACLQLGFDMTREPLPVVPAAHYTCGGVYVSGVSGKSDVPGLWAIGEVAATGMHGANRLASNSLLECVAMARAAAITIQDYLPTATMPTVTTDISDPFTGIEEPVFVSHDWHEIRQLMWDYVGIVRNEQRLSQALQRLCVIREALRASKPSGGNNRHWIECQHLATVAWLTVQAAIARTETRGLHARSDYPKRQVSLDGHHSCLQKDDGHSWLLMD